MSMDVGCHAHAHAYTRAHLQQQMAHASQQQMEQHSRSRSGSASGSDVERENTHSNRTRSQGSGPEEKPAESSMTESERSEITALVQRVNMQPNDGEAVHRLQELLGLQQAIDHQQAQAELHNRHVPCLSPVLEQQQAPQFATGYGSPQLQPASHPAQWSPQCRPTGSDLPA
jgi:hypothetical protein